ncbi:hypothetical protein [Nitrosopumilus ureiphilus]|uniref:hypothetical protein n=1 Tax=Nitrosopumilus ureiphilus TaxID=1470067 RepID=UPI0015CBC6D9|nr:hypothetical protein [Nitrosopumilus ureiphilus]
MKTRFLIVVVMMALFTPLIFENVYALSDELSWYFLIVAYWPLTVLIVGIILVIIFSVWKKRK